ncbi:polysaccharide deacetylase family protein [Paenibacillus apiarius]|uniref:Polysaccharide deacetylase n=1 Tax=Paenibacillus apiarius TaxID=46240 RepID=A0ABT4DSS1_9BACL|nr:polysaccharide deacetylase family protein [Paenibacillus apiarius]MCY9515782.1 polysaccharide deacetylase [Paenibacillus apiarius]MCY9520404.1 polysaccharide deacetylase [Paenibacillus apiarius]MCY9554988.1 polysaccharide deacetylase [Paenibacillus apiarius]MCY9559058.1 polysaccharide deacetylase [Paenibacillus apiarius]MCY9685639.1 polysaccharide deacetylase [Paenibacillus apiarius]
MVDRGAVTVGKRRRRSRKKFIGRMILFLLCVAIGIGIYAAGKSLLGTVSASGSDLIVTEVATFASAAKEKETPKEFNGMTRKVAYLTFDDGPSKYSNDMMDLLKKHDIKATYFMLGDNMNTYPDAVKRMVEEGHYPGLHSMTHDYNRLYKSGGSGNFIKEFQEAQGIVENLTGFKPTLIRAPYGSAPQIGESFRKDIADAGFKMWDWTLDSLDWKFIGQPNRILEQIKGTLTEDVEVILLHDRQQTLEALPSIIEYIQSKGYEFEVYDPNAHFVCNFHHDKRL